MSEYVTISPEIMGWMFIALCNLVTAMLTVRTHNLALQTEKNTNSMKDALVKATGQAQHAAGMEAGRAEGAVKAAALAEGKATSPIIQIVEAPRDP
jgi:hypothetical protein